MSAVRKNKSNTASGEAVSAKKRNASGLAGISLIVYLIDKLSCTVYNALANGFFGYIFTAYSSELNAYTGGYLVSYFRGGSKTRKFLRTVREYLSRSFETSFILKKLRRAVLRLAYVPLKTYGSFLLSFGIYTLLVYFIKRFLPISGNADIDYVFIAIALCVVALPIYFSRISLAEAVRSSKFTSAVFVEAFGYREESFEGYDNKKRVQPGVAVFFGLLAGLLSFLVHPLSIILFLLLIIIAVLIIINPEIGVLLSIFGLPFFSVSKYPTVVLAILVFITTFSYVIKLVRGKRIFKLDLLDLAVVIFLALTLLSGSITVGGRPSYYAALLSAVLLCGYFLTVNLIRTQKWIHRCVLALLSSGTIVAFIGVAQYLLGKANKDWLDTSYFADISGRVTSLFANPNYLAAYLCIVLPFALYQLAVCKARKERLLSFICIALILACIIFTWSRGAWLAVLVSSLVFLLIFSKKTVRFLWVVAAAVPFLGFVLPKNIVTRFMSIGDLADSSTMYRLYTWRGSVDLLKDYFWGGIGYGTEAFAQLYPMYAYAGIENAVHSHSLYLQILISMGVAGLLCFALVMLFYFQKSFEHLTKPASRDGYLIVLAAMTAVLSMLIMGLFDYVWYNYRIFFLFWVALGMGVACIRIEKRELDRNSLIEYTGEYSASIDVEV